MKYIEDIKRYKPVNEQEDKDKEIILGCIDKFDDVLTRENEVAHLTSSMFVINKAKNKALMIYHNIYNAWGWTGGHADGDSDLLSVAIREVMEETGVKNVHPVTEDIISLDILAVLGHVKKGKYVAPHLHLSIAYLGYVDEDEELIIKPDENSGVKWIPIDKISECTNEGHMQKVYAKILKKAMELK